MPQHIDLRALDPDESPDAARDAELFVTRVMSAVERQSDPYPRRADPLHAIWLFARPALVAAAIVIAVAGSLFVKTRRETARPRTIAEAVGVPPIFLAASAGTTR